MIIVASSIWQLKNKLYTYETSMRILLTKGNDYCCEFHVAIKKTKYRHMKRAMRKLLTKKDDYLGEFHMAIEKQIIII